MAKQLSGRKMNEIIESMRTMFEPATLDLGWQYFHRGRVRNMTFSDKEIRAEVVGPATTKATVRLNLTSLSSSQCSCQHRRYCKHMASVCFNIYSSFGRPELLLQDLVQQVLQRKKRSAVLQAKTQKKAQPAKTITLGNSPRSWQKYFDQQFYGFPMTNQNAVEELYATVTERSQQLTRDWEENRRKFVFLHAYIFVLRKCNQFHAHNDTAYLSYYLEMGIRSVSEDVMNKLESIVAEISTIASIYPARWITETAEVLEHIVFRQGKQMAEMMDVYRILWIDLMNDSKRIEREKKKIVAELEKTESSPLSAQMTLALAHFDFMAEDDESALDRLGHMPQSQLYSYLWYLRRLRHQGQWSRLLSWLRHLVPVMHHADQALFRMICSYWTELSAQQASDEEWLNVMRMLLPRSYEDYSDYLLQTGRYRQWVDLQLSQRTSLEDLPHNKLKKIEQYDHQLLLPLYHQSAERYIMEKNRSSYVAAIKILRKLRTYYMHLEQSDRWNDFILNYAEKHHRLKAFQEELMKGKLIP